MTTKVTLSGLIIEDREADANELVRRLRAIEEEKAIEIQTRVLLYGRLEQFKAKLSAMYPRGSSSNENQFDFVSFDLMFAERTTSPDIDGGIRLIDWLADLGALDYMGEKVVRSNRSFDGFPNFSFHEVNKGTGQETDQWRAIIDKILSRRQAPPK